MTRPRRTPGSVTRDERLDLIRRLLLEGTAEWRIKRLLLEGFTLPDGRTVKVGSTAVFNDLQAIGDDYRHLHDNPGVHERIAGVIFERLSRIALKAEAAGQFHAAISANSAILRLVGLRSTRWRAAEPEAPTRPDEGEAVGELAELTDAELVARARATRARARALGLAVVDGEGEGGGQASGSR